MKELVTIAALLLLAGCATQSEKLARHGTVIPHPDGFFVATGHHRNTNTALKIALASAEQECIKRNKNYVVYDNMNTEDDALINEGVAKVADIASRVAAVTGSFIPGGDIIRGNKHTQITFKCE